MIKWAKSKKNVPKVEKVGFHLRNNVKIVPSKLNAVCPNFGSFIWQKSMRLFDDIYHLFLEGDRKCKANS